MAEFMKCVEKALEISRVVLILAIFGGVCNFYAWAEEPSGEASPAAEAATRAPTKKPVKGGKRTRDKDADGTEAFHQFQENTVLKSQYKLNGQPLEVDPD